MKNYLKRLGNNIAEDEEERWQGLTPQTWFYKDDDGLLEACTTVNVWDCETYQRFHTLTVDDASLRMYSRQEWDNLKRGIHTEDHEAVARSNAQ